MPGMTFEPLCLPNPGSPLSRGRTEARFAPERDPIPLIPAHSPPRSRSGFALAKQGAGIQDQNQQTPKPATLGPRWSLYSGRPKDGPEYGDERLNVMMNVAERKQASAPTEAQHWLASFEAALRAKDTAAAADLFQPTASGATCWPSPGRSRPCPASRQSKRRCAKRSRARRPEIFIFPRNERRRAGSRAPAPKQSKRCSNSKRHSGRAPASCASFPTRKRRRGC